MKILDDVFDPNSCVFEEDEELYKNYGEFFEEYCPNEAEYWSAQSDDSYLEEAHDSYSEEAHDSYSEEAHDSYSEEAHDSYSDYSYFYHDTQPEEQTTYSCDTCEKDFWSKDYFDKHMAEHITCKLDGCTFTAHEKIVEKHIRMQHSTGLYDKIKKLNTPEDIAKWIEERKKNYPNKENIEKRYARQMEKLQRGERIPKNDNRFGKDKFRWGKNQAASNQKFNPKTSKKRKQKPPPKVSLIDEKSNWNGNMFPFTGTLELFKDDEIIKSDFEDDEWQESMHSTKQTNKKTVIKLNNALGALMGAYGSDSEEDYNDPIEVPNIETEKTTEKSIVPNATQSDADKLMETAECEEKTVKETNDISDDEPPDEIKIEKTPKPDLEVNVNPHNVPSQVSTTSENTHSTSTTNRQRNRKRKRPNKKEKARKLPARSDFVEASTSRRRPANVQGLSNNKFRRRKVSLLEKLLANEIRDERNFLLQCVRYTVQNNFFTSDGS